ncbi:response regulator [Cohaesibacter celericrescens]|uniref:response regulator n=1 Tax=Cohaesibacter celericrescens TaxID=2067669 RepID=UPI0035646E25
MLRKIQHGSAILVDRNGYQLKMLRTLLRSSGFNRVTEFDDIETGLNEAGRSHPDFLFVDFDTAQHSELLRGQKDLRRSYLSPNTHLLFLMQNPTRKRVIKAITCGGSWVVSRPFSPTSLNRRIRAILDQDYGVALKSLKQSAKKATPKPAQTAKEDLTMKELARQMDNLLKQSKFFKDGQWGNNSQNRKALLSKFENLESEAQSRQRKSKTETDEDIFLI